MSRKPVYPDAGSKEISVKDLVVSLSSHLVKLITDCDKKKLIEEDTSYDAIGKISVEAEETLLAYCKKYELTYIGKDKNNE